MFTINSTFSALTGAAAALPVRRDGQRGRRVEPGLQDNGMSEAFQSANEALGGALGREAIKIVAAEFFVRHGLGNTQ